MNRAFNSGIDRIKAEELATKVVPVSPGPAAYKPPKMTQVGMKTISLGGRINRFDVKSNGVPTPTTYNLHDSVMDTLQSGFININKLITIIF